MGEYDFRFELDNIPWRLVEQMEPQRFKTFRSEFHMSSTNEHSATYTSSTHYSKQMTISKSATKKENDTTVTITKDDEKFDRIDGTRNGRPPDKYTSTTHITHEQFPPHNHSMQFSEIKSLKRIHKVHEGIGTDNIIDTPGIVNPYTKEKMTVRDAIASRILDVRAGKLVSSQDGEQITISDALSRGLIDKEIAQRLYSPCGIQGDGHDVTLLEAIQREIQEAEQGLLDPNEKRIKVIQSSVIDHDEGKVVLNELDTKEAFKGCLQITHKEVRLKTGAVSLYDAISQGLIDERTGWIVDRNSGSKYQIDAAVKTNIIDSDVREIVDPKTDSKITVMRALETGIINPKLGKYVFAHEKLPFLEAKRRQFIVKPMTLKDAYDANIVDSNGKISSPLHQRKLSISDAISRGVLDSNNIKSILNVATGEYITLNDALSQGIILAEGKFVNTQTNEVCDVFDAVRRGYIVSVAQKSIFDIDGFQQPDKSGYISFNAACAKGFVSKINDGSLVTSLKSGKLISFAEGAKCGEVKPEIYEKLTRKIGIFEDGKELNVIEAVFAGHINPKTGNFVDIYRDKVVPLNDAIAQNLITAEGAALLNSLLMINVITQSTCKSIHRYVTMTSTTNQYDHGKLTYTDALKRRLIDNAEQMFTDPDTNETIPIVQALNEGRLAPDTECSPKNPTGAYPKMTMNAVKVKLEKQNETNEIMNTFFDEARHTTESLTANFISNERRKIEIPPDGWALKVAIDRRFFDPNAGLFTIPGTDRLVSFEECLHLKIINPNSALVFDPNGKRLITLTRSLEKKILDSVGRYGYENGRITLEDAISDGLVVFNDATNNQYNQGNLQSTVDAGKPDTMEVKTYGTRLQPVEVCSGVIYDPSTALVLFADGKRKPRAILQSVADNIVPAESVMVVDPQTGQAVDVNEAIRLGIIDDNTYVGMNKRMDIQTATKEGLFAVRGQPVVNTIVKRTSSVDCKTDKPVAVEYQMNNQNWHVIDGVSLPSEFIPEAKALQDESTHVNEPAQMKIMDSTTINIDTVMSPAEQTRSRVTIEPTYKVAIGRAHSLSPDRDAKKVVLQKLRRRVVKPTDAVQKGLLDQATADILQSAFITNVGERLSLSEVLESKKLDGEHGEIRDPQRGDVLTINEAVNRGILDLSGTNEVLVPLNYSLSIPQLFRQGLVDTETGMIIHPETGAHLTISEAITCDIVDPLCTLISSDGCTITLEEALRMDPLNDDLSVINTRFTTVDLTTPVNHGIPPAAMTLPVALNRGLIDVEMKEFIHPFTKERISIEKAIDDNLIMAIPYPLNSESINVSDALDKKLIDVDKGTFKNPITNEYVPIAEAVENGMLVVKSLPDSLANVVTTTSYSEILTSIHTVTTKTIELLSGYTLLSTTEVMNIGTGEIMSLDEARSNGIVVDVNETKNTTTLKDLKMSFSDALNKGLVDMTSGLFTNPNSGTQMSISQALQEGILEASSIAKETVYVEDKHSKFTELNIAEAFETIHDPQTGKFHDPTSPDTLLTFSEALEKNIIDPNSMIYDVNSRKPITINQAVEKGLIDHKTGKINDRDSGTFVNFKKAAQMGLLAVIGGLAAPIAIPILAATAAVKGVTDKRQMPIVPHATVKLPQTSHLSESTMQDAERLDLPTLRTYPGGASELISESEMDNVKCENVLIQIEAALNQNMIKPESEIIQDNICLPFTVADGLKTNSIYPEDLVRIVDQNSVILVEPSRRILMIGEAISRNVITPETCKVIYEERELPYTVSDGLGRGELLPSDVIRVINETTVQLEQHDLFEKDENMEEISTVTVNKADANDVEVVSITLGDAINQNEIIPEVCRVIYGDDELNYTVQDGLNHGELSIFDQVRVISKNTVFLLGKEHPKWNILVSKTLTPEKLSALGFYNLQKNCFVDVRTNEKVTFYELLFKLNVFDTESILVKDLTQKKPTYVSLCDALERRLIDKNTGHMTDPKTGKRVPFFESVKIKWIINKADKPKEKILPITLEDMVTRADFDPKTVEFIDPHSGNRVGIVDALLKNVVDGKTVIVRDPKNMQLIPYYEAIDAQVVDRGRGVLVNTVTQDTMYFADAFLRGYVLNIRRPISLPAAIRTNLFNVHVGRVVDPLTKQLLPLDEAITRNIIGAKITEIKDNKTGDIVTLDDAISKKIIDLETGKYRDEKSQQLIPLDKAVDMDLIRAKPVVFNLLQAILLNYYLPESGKILDPKTGDHVTLREAIEYNIIDPTMTKIRDQQRDRIVDIKEAIESKLIDPEQGMLTSPILTLDQAYIKGYVINASLPWTLQDTLALKVCDQKSGHFTINKVDMSLQDAIQGKIIDPDVLTIKNSRTGDIITLSDAISLNLIDPVKGLVTDPTTNENINFYDAQDRGIIVPYKSQITLPDAVFKGYYDPNNGKFINPKNKEKLHTESAINRGYIDTTSTLVAIDESTCTFDQAISDGIIDTKEGILLLSDRNEPLDFNEAFERGLLIEVAVPMSLSEALVKGVYDPDSGLFLDPRSGEYLTLSEAIEIDLIDPKSVFVKDTKSRVWRKLRLVDAIHGNYVDGNTGRVKDFSTGEAVEVSLRRAFDMGILVDNKIAVSIQRAIHQGLYDDQSGKITDPSTQRKITLHEAIRNFIINPLLPVYYDRKNEKLLNLTEACMAGYIDKRNGTFMLTSSGESINLCNALNLGLIVDIETCHFGLYEALEMGFLSISENVFMHPATGIHYNLRDACANELINPELSLIKDLKANRYVKLQEAVQTRIIDEESSVYNLPNGNRINLSEAKHRGYIVTVRRGLTLQEAIANFIYRPDSGKFVDPLNNEYHDLKNCVVKGLIDPRNTALKDPNTGSLKTLLDAINDGNIDIERGRVLDSKSKQTYNFDKAFEKGLLVTLEKNLSEREVTTDSIGRNEPRACSLEQAIKFEIVNPDAAMTRSPHTGKLINVTNAITEQILDVNKTVSFESHSGKVRSQAIVYDQNSIIYLAEPLSFEQAIEHDHLNVTTGKFTEPQSSEALTLKESISLGFVDPDTALVKDTNRKRLVKLPEGFRKGLVDAEKGNVLDSATSKLYPLTSALSSGLLTTPRRGFTLTEAISYGLYNPTTSSFKDPFVTVPVIDRKRLTLSEAIDTNLIDPSSTVVKDPDTGAVVSLLTAIESELIDPIEGKLHDRSEDKKIDLSKAHDRGLILPAEARQAVEERYKLCDENLSKLLLWIGVVEDKIASQDVLREIQEDLRNQINTMKQIRDDLDQHSGQILHCSDQVRQLVLTAGDVLSKSEVSTLEKSGRSLKTRYDKAIDRCDKLLRRSLAARDELSKLKTELANFSTWLATARRILEDKESALADLQRLDASVDSTKEFVSDVIAHQADLRFITMSAQKFVDESRDYLNVLNDFRTSLPSRLPHIEPISSQDSPVRNDVSLVTQQYRDLLHRANNLSDRLSGLGGRRIIKKDALDKAHAWLRQTEPRVIIVLDEPIGDDPKTIEDQLHHAKVLNNEFVANGRLIDDAKHASASLLHSLEGQISPVEMSRLEQPVIEIVQKYDQLKNALADRCQDLDTALVQSQGVQDALNGIISWLSSAESQFKNLLRPASLIKERLDEQIREHRVFQSDVDTHISSIDSIYLSAGELISSSSNTRIAKKIETKLNDVKTRFDKLFDHSQKRGEFLDEVNKNLMAFNAQYKQFENWHANLVDLLESREFTKLPVEDYIVQMREIEKNRDGKRGMFEDAVRCGKELVNKRDVTDTAPIRDRIKAMENQWRDLNGILDEKNKQSKHRAEQLNAYHTLRNQVIEWLGKMESKIVQLETIAIHIETLKRQNDELKPINKEYRDYATTIDKVNDIGTTYDTLLRSDRSDSPTRKKSQSLSPTKRSSVTVSPLRHTSQDGRSPSPTKVLSPLSPGGSSGFSSRRSSQDGGFHLEELSPIQQQLSEINHRYTLLGVKINDRQSEIDMTREELRKQLDNLKVLGMFLDKLQRQLPKDVVPNSKDEIDKFNRQIKQFLEEMYEKQSLLDSTKSQVKELLKRKPGAPGADNLNDHLEDVTSRWRSLYDTLKDRIRFMEDVKEFHDIHDALSSWLSAKDRMLTVLGPISCDPRMVQSQVQQVQVLREEFRSQQPQLQHLINVGDSVLKFVGPNTAAGKKVNDKLSNVQRHWAELLGKLEERADSLGAAADTSREFDAQLTRLHDGLQAISDGLDEVPLDKDPEEQLRKVENLERQLEGQRPLLADLEAAGAQLCEVLSDPASRADIQSKLASVGRQYNTLQKKLDHRKAEIEGSLRDGRQFESSCAKTLGWLSDEMGNLSERLLISADRDVLEQQLAQHEPVYRDVLSREHEVIMLLNKGRDKLRNVRTDTRSLQKDLDKIQLQWDRLRKETVERQTRLQTCMEHCRKYYRALEIFLPWLRQAEDKLDSLRPSSFKRKHIEKQLKDLQAFRNDVWKRSGEYENTKSLGEAFVSSCDVDKDMVKGELNSLKHRWDKLNNDLIEHTQRLEDQARKLADFNESLRDLQHGLERCEDKLASHDTIGGATRDPKLLDRIKNLKEEALSLKKPLQACRQQVTDLVNEARENGIDANHLQDEVDGVGDRVDELIAKLDDRCTELQSAATAVTQYNERVKTLTHDLSDLETELDTMKPPGRDFKTVRMQIDDITKLMKKLHLAADNVSKALSLGEQLVDGGFASDTVQTRQQVESLGKLLARLEDRGHIRERDLEGTLKKLEDFYLVHAAVIDDIDEASKEVRKLKPVGSEVDNIRAQQADFKRFRTQTVEPLVKNVDECNRAGQGLIQSAASGVNTTNLEKDLEKMNEKWNDLKERINDRERRLDVALLQSGKFQEALDGLAKWLTDTEELVSNQKPPSADYKVVKAQLQEQKFLKKMLLDRQNSMSSLFSMGNEIAKEAESSERKAIEKQLKDLIGRFDALTEGAQQRTLDLEQAMRVAKEFQDKLVPLQDWVERTERKVKDMEIVPTDEEKIQQRIREHDVLHDDILNKKPDFSELTDVASNLMSLVGEDEAAGLGEKLQEVTDRYSNLVESSEIIGQLLSASRQGLRHLVLTYQELAAWMDAMEQRLSRYKVLAVHPDKLLEQMDALVNLTEDIATRQQDVDSTVDSGVELMRHISSDEALQLKEKLDSLQRRYNELTARGADLLKHAQIVLPLVQQFHASHNRLVEWMQEAEGVLQSSEPLEGDIARLEVDLQELKPVLEAINLVGPQLSQASPGEGAATIEGLVMRDNRRFDAIAEQIQRRAERIHLGKQRALEVTSDIDELLEWFREVESQIRDAEKPYAEPDLIRVQLKEHKALNDDISSQKGRVRDVLSTARKVLRESPPSEDTSVIREKMDDLRESMDTVSGLSSDRLGILEQALPLAEHFNDTHGVLSNWLGDMEEQVAMLSMPALRPDLIAQQQDRNEMFVQSINEHKPLVDKLNKTGEALVRLCNEDDGVKVQEQMDADNDRYAALKLELRERQRALEHALQESSQFSDKLEGMLRALSNAADQVNNQEPISAHPPKIVDQMGDNDTLVSDLDKRKEAYAAVKRAADDVISKAANRADPAVKDIKRKLDRLKNLWDDIQRATSGRGHSLEEALQAAEKFWKELHAVMAVLKELRESLASQEPPAVEPKAIQKQQVALQEIRYEIDQTKPDVDHVRTSGHKLMQLCGEPDKPEVKKHIEDLDNAWDNITALYAKREENLIDAMEKAMEFHETLQNLMEFLENAEAKFVCMGQLGSDIDVVKKQIEQLKKFKAEVDPHMVKVEALNRQAQELTERTSNDQAAAIKEPLLVVNRRWDDLLRGIVERQRQLENALLRLGQFQHALNELLVWIGKTDETLDELKPVAGDPQILEIELAKLKVLINDIQAHQTSVDTLNDAGRQLIESGEGTDEASFTQEKLNTLNIQWRALMQKAADRQRELEDALTEAQHFNADIQDLLSWLGDVDAVIAASKPVGGLPETASEQLERFMEVYNELEDNRPKVETVLAKGQDYLKKGSNAASNLQHNLRTLKQRWDSVTSRANDKKIKLEIALKEATEFHNSLQAFVNWLTNAEKVLSNLKPVSRVLDTTQSQIEEHKNFQKDVGAHREVMLNLDKKGTHLKYFSQKQDVILIKNLLISVQHRWERVASKSAERTRALDLGYKEAKEFHDSWSSLMRWLTETEQSLEQLANDNVGNDPESIKSRLAKHQEFQRALSAKQASYDNTMKMGKLLKDKAPKHDEPTLRQMIIDLKNKWTTVCSRSVDRQRKLEEALLYSGQFKDAVAALLLWLQKVEKELSDERPVHGDLDTVNHLVEQHRRFQQDLEARNVQMESVIQTGHDLEIKANRVDATTIRAQLTELTGLWDLVTTLADRKTARLEEALREAEKLHKLVHMLLEWLTEAERTLRFAGGNAPHDEVTAHEQLRMLEKFKRELREKEIEKDATLELAHNVLAKAHPDAIHVIKNWITVIQSRWEEVSQWAQQRYQKLSSHVQSLKDLDDCLEELIAWLLGLENTLHALKQEELPMDIPTIERLIVDHKEFMENTQLRQAEVDRVCKAKQITSTQAIASRDPRKFGKNKTPLRGSQHDVREPTPDNYGSLSRKQSFKGSQNLNTGPKGSRSSPGRELSPDPQVPHIGPRFASHGSGEPEFKSPRVKMLYDKWRHVWMLSWERQRELYSRLAYLKEKQRADNFSWDDWRKRFLKFMNHKKSRLTDLFRKMDKDNNGLIPRGDFIDGIINTKFDTNRLEMKEVADMFDRNNRGLIDWKEFIAALRPDWEEKKPDHDAQKIHDEVKRLVMLCTCRQKFRVFQVGEGKYRFGESQKLRLVRILRSTVMVRVGGGWVALDEFLLKNDPCRAKGRTNIELREQFILADGVSQSMTAFKPKTSMSSPASGSSASSLRMTTGPITKVRERSGRSVPMGSTVRTSRTATGTPDSQSDTEGNTLKTRKSSYRSTLTPGGSRPSSQPTSRAGSRPGSKAPSRHGSNLSLDSTDDGTPSRIPRRSATTRSGTSTPRRLAVANGSTSSRPRTPTGLVSPASPAGRSSAIPRASSIPTLSTFGTLRSRIPVYKGVSGDTDPESPSTSSSCSVSFSSGSVGKTRTTTTTTPSAPTLRTASRTRTPSGSNTPVPTGMQTAASKLLRKTGSTETSSKKPKEREPFRL